MQTRTNITTRRERANQGPSKLLTADCIQSWPEIFVGHNGRQNFCSETLVVDTKQFLEEGIHLVMCEHSIVQTEENLNYIMTETRKGHGSLAFASSKQTSVEMNVNFELLQECAQSTALQKLLQHSQ